MLIEMESSSEGVKEVRDEDRDAIFFTYLPAGGIVEVERVFDFYLEIRREGKQGK